MANFIDLLNNVGSFDTETTGLNKYNNDIWQTGFHSKNLRTNREINNQSVANPFVRRSDLKTIDDFEQALISSNGVFSKNAHAQGHFTELLGKYAAQEALDLDKAVRETLGQVQPNTFLLMQNYNFENAMLAGAVEKGTLSRTTYENVAEKMRYVRLGSNGEIDALFQMPPMVQDLADQAYFTYHAEFKAAKSGQRELFNRYTNTLNQAYDVLKGSLQDPTGKAIVAEQMFLTRTLYANAVEAGLMEPRYATTGTSIEFLSNIFFNKSETHLALFDAIDTVNIGTNHVIPMIDELRSGNISQSTREIFSRINEAQSSEVQRQFVTSLISTTNDFKEKGFTKKYDHGAYHSSDQTILDVATNKRFKLKGRKSGSKYSSRVTNYNSALENVLERYKEYDGHVARVNMLNSLKEEAMGKSYDDILNLIDEKKDLLNVEYPKTEQSFKPWYHERTTLFGKDVSKGTKATVLGGAGALLATMYLTTRPSPREENSYVSQQFYDDQYLGTEFINFENRNKHYMY